MNRPYFQSFGAFISALAFSLVLSMLGGPPADAAGLLVAEGGLGGALEIVDHDVHVVVNNGVVVTRVEQVFRNTENRVVEALYTFPVPKGASVAGFSMWIDGQEMVGEVLEKERAREIYESYKRVQRDPGLLEQVDYRTFEMRIFPIAARAEQRVEVTYYQELDFDHDQATYVYPLATVTRPEVDAAVRGRFSLDLEVRSEVPITNLWSPSHRDDFVMVDHGAKYRQASLELAGGDLRRDLVLAMSHARPRTGLDLVASRRDGEDGHFQLTLTLGEELQERQEGMDYVFVLDVSGSMDRDGKLAVSRGAVEAFVEALEPGDRFEIITFNASLQPLFGNLRGVADGAGAVSEATSFLVSQRARGGTFLRPAIDTAYGYQAPDRPLNVVVISDGMTEQRERSELHAAIAARPSGARVFAIGVGNEVDRGLLQQIAERAGGLAAFVSQGDDFARQATAFRRKLRRPAATDVSIDFSGGGVYDVEPQDLPALFHGAPLRLYGRYRDPGTVDVQLAANVGGERIEQSVQLEFPASGDAADNPEIERMWAWKRVDRLLKDADRTGSKRDVGEIVRLGEAYSIVTEHTSFLVLENDAEFKRWNIERRNELRLARERGHQARVREELDAMRRKARTDLGPDPVDAPSKIAQAPKPTPGTPRENAPEARPSRNADVNLGGGALDPFSVLAALGLGGLAAYRRRRGASGP